MNIKKIIISILITILFIAAIGASINGFVGVALVINLLASTISLLFLKNLNGGYTNLTIIFYGFSILYGLSGPVAVYWGEGLHSIFGYNFNVSIFLIAYSLSNVGFIIGVILYNSINANRNKKKLVNDNVIEYFEKNKKMFITLAVFLAFISMIFEIVNFVRVGGFYTIMSGKAAYQSAVSELTLSLPSRNLAELGFVLLSIYMAITLYKKSSVSKLKMFLYIVFSVPYFSLTIFLGKRGVILSFLMILIMGLSFFKPLKRIKAKLVIILVILYIFTGFLYANRGIASLLITDTEYFVDVAFNKERIVKALNPGAQEFGAPFGNFNKFYTQNNGDYQLILGESYLRGLALPIPSFMYPGEKPQQIGYIFRDIYFPSEAARGSIAGTAFSSILEAYWNFSYSGIIMIYFLLAYFLQFLDKKYKYKSRFSSIVYLVAVPQVITFHRTSMGNVFASMIINIILISLFVFFLSDLLFKKATVNSNTIDVLD